MATKYALQQKGVADSSKVPADKADGRQVGAHKRTILASKDAGVDAWNSGDVIYLGKKPANEKIVAIRGCTDTSFATSTLSIGDGTTADKYVAAKTLTATDVPTTLGPKASTLDDAPGDEEELWLTIGVANIAAAVVATIEIELAGI